MATPTLTLLGAPRLTGSDGAVVPVRARKEVALLAYLAVESARPQQRETLLSLLWPEAPEDAARLSLRVALAHLRTVLGDTGGVTLVADRHTVQLVPRDERWLDVAAFTALLATCRTHRHPPDAPCSACKERLAQAAALYRGEFLAGLALPDADPFEEWALVQREELHRAMLAALAALAAAHEQTADYAALGHCARRQLELEPWHEPAHRQLMRGLALRGERDAALTQYERCRQALGKELGIEPEVETRRLYERIRSGDLTPATRDIAAPRHNLPAPLTPLVGREADLAALTDLLHQEEVRLLSLVGPGGMGKTRLALELARASVAAYADGVFVIELAPLAAAEGLATAIATALDLTLQGDPAAALLRFLRDKRLLLILDNVEHLLAGVGLVGTIVQAAPRVQIIATSRERLNLRGEQLYSVQGLAHAAGTTAAAAATPAVRLFVQTARRQLASFTPRAEDLAAILRICHLVQGMPLALELAAAWAGLLSLEEIAAEIARSVDFLAADWPDAPARQRSMRAVFAWSWQLLTDAERQVFGGLSVFRGGFTRPAAETIAGTTLGALTSLTRKSLLRRTDAGASGALRYEIHELLRQFGAEALEAVPADRGALHARHSAFYLEFVAVREQRLARDDPREAAAEIRGELDNIRQAWTWAATHAEGAALERAAYGWWQSCLLNGLENEIRQLFGLAAEHLRVALDGLDNHHQARQQCQRALSTILAIHANHIFSHVPHDLMAAEAREAMQLGATSGGVEGETFGMFVLGRALQELGQHREARTLWEQAVQRVRAHHRRQAFSDLLAEVERMASVWLVGSSLFFGDHAGAREYAMGAVRLCQALRKRRSAAYCRSMVAMIDFYTGDDEAARQCLEDVVSQARTLEDRSGEIGVQWELAEVLRVQGHYERARMMLGSVVSVARDLGSRYAEIHALATLVRLHCQLGDAASAQAWYDQLVQMMGHVGITPDSKAAGLRACAIYALHTGNHQQALADAEEGAQLTELYDIPYYRAEAAVILGHARTGMNQLAAAATAYEQAVTWYAQLGNAPLASEPRAGLAQLALAHGDRVRAHTLVEPLLPVLAASPRACVQTPFYAYLICYRVLEASHDPRATSLLQMARQRLGETADHLADDALRRSFVENVPAHRELLRATREAAALAEAGPHV